MDTMIFIDASVLVEIVRDKSRKEKCLDKLMEYDKFGYSACISVLTLSIVWHYGEKVDSDFESLKSFLDEFRLLDISVEDTKLGYEIWNNEDFEDALQIACSTNNKIVELLTLDKKLQSKYKDLLKISLI